MTSVINQRLLGADAARACALVLMTCTHTLRVAAPHHQSDLSLWLMRLEPITPTLFALLVGAGLAASQIRRPPANWRAHHLLRGLALIALSWLLFLPYYGPQWPASLTSTGILQCLGSAIIAIALISSPAATGIAGVGLLAVWTIMEARGIRIDGLNQGSFPIFPYVPFALLAHAWTRFSHQRESLRGILSVSAVLVVVAMAVSPGFRVAWGPWGITDTFQQYTVSMHGSGSWNLLKDLATGVPVGTKRMSFWHTRPVLVPLMVSMASLFIVFFRTATQYMPSDIHFLATLGRHSLGYYLGHFIGLGLLSLLPLSLRHAGWTWLAATSLMVLLGIFYSIWRESRAQGASA